MPITFDWTEEIDTPDLFLRIEYEITAHEVGPADGWAIDEAFAVGVASQPAGTDPAPIPINDGLSGELGVALLRRARRNWELETELRDAAERHHNSTL